MKAVEVGCSFQYGDKAVFRYSTLRLKRTGVLCYRPNSCGKQLCWIVF